MKNRIDTLNAVQDFVVNRQISQSVNYRFELPLPPVIVPQNSVIQQVTLNISADASFHMKGFNGSFTVPAGELPDCAVQITDLGNGNALTEGFVDLETILSPGAVIIGLIPSNLVVFDFDYLFDPTAQIQFQFINRSGTADVTVKWSLHGRKLKNRE